MTRIKFALAWLAIGAGGCSTWLNDTAPAMQDGYVYAAGARQKVFSTKATVWLCPTKAASPDACKLVDVSVSK
ncbi:MAG: hypothetical protein U0168_07845 [Nannocystaceae bacterium]|jgi:uncharacterized protein YceK